MFALEGAEGNDLGDLVLAVFVLDIADDLVPPFVAEVHVDIGHTLAARIEEALKQELVADGVNVGDFKGIGNQAAGCGAAARPDGNALGAGIADEVGHDQEVAGETHIADDTEFIGQTVLIGLFGGGGPSLWRRAAG